MNFVPVIKNNSIWLIGFLLLAVPSLYEIYSVMWSNGGQEHGPIILAIVGWLFWRELPKVLALPEQSNWFGWILMVLAGLAYVVGRSQQVWMFELGAFIPFLAGVILLNKGWRGLCILCCPLFFMLFFIPMPGFIVDSFTSGLKQHISQVAEVILYGMGYPVARSGVTLTIGQYQLLVADACSGINSLFSLLALGLIYLYLQGYASRWRNILIMLAIVPVAIIANIVRVMILVLVTYYLGDEAGQGYLHGLAGILLFIMALSLLFAWDKLLGLFISKGEI